MSLSLYCLLQFQSHTNASHSTHAEHFFHEHFIVHGLELFGHQLKHCRLTDVVVTSAHSAHPPHFDHPHFLSQRFALREHQDLHSATAAVVVAKGVVLAATVAVALFVVVVGAT